MVKHNESTEIEWLNVFVGKEIIGQLNAKDKKTIKQLKDIVQTVDVKDIIFEFLKSLGVPSSEHNNLFNILISGTDMNKFVKYINNRLDISNLTLNSIIDLNDINKKELGIYDTNITKILMNYKWASSPAIGSGELYLPILINNTKRASGGGDILINNNITEVKGIEGRLIGQVNYGDYNNMRTKFYNYILDLLTYFNKKDNLNYNDNNEIKILFDLCNYGGDTNFWNFNPKNLGISKFLKTISDIRNKNFDYNDIKYICTNLIECFTEFFIQLDNNLKQKYINLLINSNSLNKDGSLNIKEFNKIFLLFYFEYYFKNEEIKYFCIINQKLGLLLILDNPENIIKFIDKEIKYSPPGFGSRAQKQASTYSITLK